MCEYVRYRIRGWFRIMEERMSVIGGLRIYGGVTFRLSIFTLFMLSVCLSIHPYVILYVILYLLFYMLSVCPSICYALYFCESKLS